MIRLCFAIAHKDWTVEDWNKVLWSDESLVRVGELPQKPRIWRQSNEKYFSECIVPKFKGERIGIMVWACFTGTKISSLVVLDRGGQGGQEYLRTLEIGLIPFLNQLFPTNNSDTISVVRPNDFVFM